MNRCSREVLGQQEVRFLRLWCEKEAQGSRYLLLTVKFHQYWQRLILMEAGLLKHGFLRPAIHSDFIWIIQISFLKFSEIQITWYKIQIFFGFEFGRDYYIKVLYVVVKFRFFSIYSDFSVRSKWQVCFLSKTERKVRRSFHSSGLTPGRRICMGDWCCWEGLVVPDT